MGILEIARRIRARIAVNSMFCPVCTVNLRDGQYCSDACADHDAVNQAMA